MEHDTDTLLTKTQKVASGHCDRTSLTSGMSRTPSSEIALTESQYQLFLHMKQYLDLAGVLDVESQHWS